jgi:hypothetical protein
MRIFINRSIGTPLDFGNYPAHGTHQVQDVFMKFASIMKTIAPSNSVTLEEYKPLNTRRIAKAINSATTASLFGPILYTASTIPERRHRGGV